MEGTRNFGTVYPVPEYIAAQVDGSTGQLTNRPMKNCGIARMNSLITSRKTFQRVPAKAYQKQRSCSSESSGV